MSQIVVALQEEPEQRGLRTPSCSGSTRTGCKACREPSTDGSWSRQGGGPITQAVDRGGSSGRQPDLTLGFQLQEQAPSGHVLELAGAVAPVPGEAQVAREPRAIRVGMSFQPRSNPRDFFGADQPPLNDRRAVHWLRSSGRGKLSPEQNKKVLSFAWSCCWSAQISPPAGVGNVKMRIAGTHACEPRGPFWKGTAAPLRSRSCSFADETNSPAPHAPEVPGAGAEHFQETGVHVEAGTRKFSGSQAAA